MAEMSSRISSAMIFRLASSSCPDRATEMVSPRNCSAETMGFSVSAGKVGMASTLLLMSFKALVMSVSCRSSTMTVQPPSLAVLRMRSSPSTPSSACSMRMHTASSTSSGAAPR